MAEGRRKEQWSHTSALIAALINSNPFRTGPPVSPDKFNPYAEPDRRSASERANAIALPFKSLRYTFNMSEPTPTP